MDTNTKKSLSEYIKEAEPYKEDEIWVDDCKNLEEVAKVLVTLKKEIEDGKFSNSRKG